MLHHMFYFGVILPTTLVIIFFILFLLCWFKCGLRERFTRNNTFQKGSSHNSTQSSLVTTSSGLPYANGPPSKTYWEIDLEHDTKVDKKEPKYIPGDFSTKSEDWIYMSHDHAQTVTGLQSTESVDVHVWSGSRSETSLDSQTSSRHDERASPEKVVAVDSNRSSPVEPVTRLGVEMTLPLRAVDSSSIHWKMIPNPDKLPHYYPSTAPGFEFTDRRVGQAYLCSPYAITNLIQPPAQTIRV